MRAAVKLLMWHCEELEYQDAVVSTRPDDVNPVGEVGTRFRVEGVVLVFVTCETEDSPAHCAAAADAILKHEAMIKPQRGLVLMPFAHLSGDLAEPEVARSLLLCISEEVSKSVSEVHLATFGFHKLLHFRVSVAAHPGSVAFRYIVPKRP